MFFEIGSQCHWGYLWIAGVKHFFGLSFQVTGTLTHYCTQLATFHVCVRPRDQCQLCGMLGRQMAAAKQFLLSMGGKGDGLLVLCQPVSRNSV